MRHSQISQLQKLDMSRKLDQSVGYAAPSADAAHDTMSNVLMTDPTWEELMQDLSHNQAHSRVKILCVRDYIHSASIAGRNQVIARLLRSGALTGEEAATLLDDTSLVPSPPPSPPEPAAAVETSNVQIEGKPQSLSAAAHEIFFSTPSAEHCKTYLDTIMLLTTLMFGFGASFLVSFGAEDLEAADARWFVWCTNSTIRELPRMSGWCDGIDTNGTDTSTAAASAWTSRPSIIFGERSVLTFGTLATSLAMAWTQYIVLLGFRLDSASDAVRRKWWRLFQWPCHLAMGLFLIGSLCFGWTISVVMRIVFTTDVDLLLAGSEGGLWNTAQTINWVVVGLWIAVSVVDVILWLCWYTRN